MKMIAALALLTFIFWLGGYNFNDRGVVAIGYAFFAYCIFAYYSQGNT
jgi:hypothetical protein